MFSTELPPTQSAVTPAFTDVADCEKWLSQLQYTNIAQTHQSVAAQVGLLNAFTLPAAMRLAILEKLREPVSFVQAEYAKRVLLKALPFNDAELAAFQSILALWEAMQSGYRRCLNAAGEDAALSEAQLCQRVIGYLGLQFLEHYRAGYEFDAALWQRLHRAYAFAETQQVAVENVDDTRNETGQISSAALYARILLVSQASPYELSRAQQHQMESWLNLWAKIVRVSATVPATQNDVPPLEIDLDGAQGAYYCNAAPVAGASLRYLDTSALNNEMQINLALLQKGKSPEDLGLGRDCVQPDCAEFMARLRQLWCDGRSTRFLERHPVTDKADVCFGINGAHVYTTGSAFTQPKQSGKLTAQQQKEIAAFGHVVSHTGEGGGTGLQQLGFPLETWSVMDKSALGARLMREKAAGERVSHNRLIGFRQRGSEFYLLAAIRWIMVSRTGAPQLGVRILPGVPQPLSLRAAGLGVKPADPYVQAFMLPAVAALQTPPTLVLPGGWYAHKRNVEILQDSVAKTVTLDFLVERGADYERVSFTAA